MLKLKSSQIRDFIIEKKRKLKSLSVKETFPTIVDKSFKSNIDLNEFLNLNTYKLL